MEQSVSGTANGQVTGLPPGQPAGWYPDPETPGQKRYFDGQSWTGHRASPVQVQGSPPRKRPGTKRLTLLVIVVGVLVIVPGIYIGMRVVSTLSDQSQGQPQPAWQSKAGKSSEWAKWTHSPEGQQYAEMSRTVQASLAPLAAATDPATAVNAFYQLRVTAKKGLRLPNAPRQDFNRAWDRAMHALMHGRDCLEFDQECKDTIKSARQGLRTVAHLFNKTDPVWKAMN